MKITFALLLIGYFALHSVLANQSIKHFLQKIISPTYYRLFFNSTALGLLIPIVYIYFQLTEIHLFKAPIWFTAASYLVLVIGVVLLIFAFRQYNFGEFSGMDALQKEQQSKPITLQKTGLNSFVRHPLYFATLLVFWSLFFARPTDVMLILAVIATLYIYIGTKLEEQKLVVQFGQDYLDYQKAVPMLLPSFSNKKEWANLKEKEETKEEETII